MHDFAAIGQHRRLDELVGAVEAEALRILVDHRFQERDQVLRIKSGSAGRDPSGHIRIADHLHALDVGNLVVLGTFNIAAPLDCEIHGNRTRAHGLQHVAADEPRCRPAGNERRGDNDVLLGDMIGDERGLLGLILPGHFLGVAAGGLRRLEFLVLDGDEFRAERGDLLLGRQANVGRRNLRAETPRRGDRLQAGNAGTHDEDLCRRHGAGRRHHHRQRPVVDGSSLDHGLITREVGLRRQHVHRLGAGDARHQLHGKAREPRARHFGKRRFVAIGVHDGDDDGPALVARDLLAGRTPDLEDDIRRLGILDRAYAGTDGFIFGIRNTRRSTRAGLDHHIETETPHLLDRFNGSCDARLVRHAFLGHENQIAQRQHLASNGSAPECDGAAACRIMGKRGPNWPDVGQRCSISATGRCWRWSER